MEKNFFFGHFKVGDVAVLDISAITVPQVGSKVKDVPAAWSFCFHTEDGDTVVPDFLDAIVGIQGGETKCFPFVFPDSWVEEDLRGLSCQFTVECKELFYREMPEMNDAIADKLIPRCTTIEQVLRSDFSQGKEYDSSRSRSHSRSKSKGYSMSRSRSLRKRVPTQQTSTARCRY